MESLPLTPPISASMAIPRSVIPLPVAADPAPQTLAALFETEESGLLRYALSIVRNRSVAEELVQETFLRLHPLWSEVENPRAWLYRSLRNLALNHLRGRRETTELHEETASSGTALPADQLQNEEAVGMMRLLLAELPEEDRQLIQLKYHDDLKYQAISQRTGLSVGNVGYRLHHLLKSLADSLRRAGIESSQG